MAQSVASPRCNLTKSASMYYPGYLGIVVAPSNTGKTTFTLNALKTGPRPDWQKRVWLYTFDQPEEGEQILEHSKDIDSHSAHASSSKADSLTNAPPSPGVTSSVSINYDSELESESESLSKFKIEKKSYGSFLLDEIPPDTFLILDELNDALQRFPNLIEKIENIFTTQAHHRNISVVCLCQTILRTPIFRLLRLTHALSLQTQQGSNVELLRHLPLYKETIANLRQFLAVHQDRALFVTVYANPPYKYQILVGTLFAQIGAVSFLLSMNEKGRDLSRVSQDAAKIIKPLLEKGYKNGLAILPLDMIDTTKSAMSDEIKNDKIMGSEEERKRVLEENVRHMINLTAPFTQRSRYNALWYFIRNEANFHIDENTLLLFCGQYKIGLQKFLHALLSPSHLGNSQAGKKRRKLSPLSDDVIFMTAVLMQNPSFNEAKIANTRLKKAAQKMRDEVDLPIQPDGDEEEDEEEEEEEESVTDCEVGVISDSDSDSENSDLDAAGTTNGQGLAEESKSESEEELSTEADSEYESDVSEISKPEIVATFDSAHAASENSQRDSIGYVREPDVTN